MLLYGALTIEGYRVSWRSVRPRCRVWESADAVGWVRLLIALSDRSSFALGLERAMMLNESSFFETPKRKIAVLASTSTGEKTSSAAMKLAQQLRLSNKHMVLTYPMTLGISKQFRKCVRSAQYAEPTLSDAATMLRQS